MFEVANFADGFISFFTAPFLLIISAFPVASSPVDVATSLGIVLSAFDLFGRMDRYVPIHEMVQVWMAAFAITNAWALLWVAGWVYQRLPFKAT